MTGPRSRRARRTSRRAYPFLVAHPVALSEHGDEVRRIEESHWFTNFGPEVVRFEKAFVRTLFRGEGSCTSVSNATLGIMLCIRAAMLRQFSTKEQRKRTIALVPSFTFPATAQTVVWNGLRVAFFDVDPDTWLPSPASIERLIDKFGSKIAVIVPYATFGNNLDLNWYESLRDRHGIPVVVDAAASAGSRLADKRHFGQGSTLPIVFSMHATKLLSTSEGGVVYSNDAQHIADVRSMSNFGFDAERVVRLPGVNAKLPEITALQARLKLGDVARIVRRRRVLADRYRKALPEFQFQKPVGEPAHTFLAARIDGDRSRRDRLIERAAADGVELRKYYNPPLHRQEFFDAVASDVRNTDVVADQIITLPLYDSLSDADVDIIAGVTRRAFQRS